MLPGTGRQFPTNQCILPVSLGCGICIVGNHEDTPAFLMFPTQELEDHLPVFGVKISRWLVGQDQAGIKDQRAGAA